MVFKKKFFTNTTSSTQIFIMSCHRDVWFLIFALYSIHTYVSSNITPVINHDGSLNRNDCLLLNFLFKGIRILSVEDFDRVKKKLKQHQACLELYKHWNGKKLLNPLLLSNTSKIILLDSDLFFIKSPEEIINFIKSSNRMNYFAEDILGYELISPVEMKFYIKCNPMKEKLNSSIICIYKKDVPSLDNLNKIIDNIFLLKKKRMIDLSHLIEQTVFFCIFSLIPNQYKRKLSLHKYINMADKAINKNIIKYAYSLHFPFYSKNKFFKYIFIFKFRNFFYY